MLSLAAAAPLAYVGSSSGIVAAAGRGNAAGVSMLDPRTMPGITEPMGFWDPLGFSLDASMGRMKFYREVELKHGRVAMLASLGFVVAEQWHPLFNGNINLPSYIAFQASPLQTFWPALLWIIFIPEFFSIWTFQSPFSGELWAMRPDYSNGDLGFDPMGLRPEDPYEWLDMQNKEVRDRRRPTGEQQSLPLLLPSLALSPLSNGLPNPHLALPLSLSLSLSLP